MTTHGRLRMAGLVAVMGVGVAVPFAVGVGPAYAQAPLSLTKSHEGDFAQGGTGTYIITLANTGEDDSGPVRLADAVGTGLVIDDVDVDGDAGAAECAITSDEMVVNCDIPEGLDSGESYTFTVEVEVADDAPCTVTNTATASEVEGFTVTVSDTNPVTGGDCEAADAVGGAAMMPVDISDFFPGFMVTP